MILCCGEALIDMLPRKTEGGETGFVPYPGGSVFNTAIALARLGVPTGFFSGLSRDLFGRQLCRSLEESRVDISPARISDRPTTLAFVSLSGGQASYHFYDENSAGRMLTSADLPMLGDDVPALLFGGISLVSEPCGSTYETMMERAATSRVSMLDPNIRPAFIADGEAHRSRMRRMMGLADIIKISEEDLAWLGGFDRIEAAARAYLSHGAKLVIATKGGEGAHGFWSGGSVFEPPLKVDVVDTVGAGDSFNAAILAWLHEAGRLTKDHLAALDEQAVREALSFATRVAAVTVSRAGANPPRRDELGGG
ncbi:carbohydrate kinase family protein [Nitratireductor luteus]|uniref:carbohydrate kinase family protein n=1 Tax=Nitratireductor luteus TaxID=2976980 RepID=UPI00223F1500|nr:carbohydrate kinase [Nitratireductor luteus]